MADSSRLSESVKKFVADTVTLSLVTPGCLLDVDDPHRPPPPGEGRLADIFKPNHCFEEYFKWHSLWFFSLFNVFLLLFTSLSVSPLFSSLFPSPSFYPLPLSPLFLSLRREPRQSNRVPRGVRTSLVANVSGNLVAGLSRMSNDDSDHK
jgi:hypothetical protein